VTIAEIFRPVTLPEFLVDYFGVAPLHAQGEAARFGRLTAAVAGSLERELEAPVHAEYSEESSTLVLHRGERDVIVLQTNGQTRWDVYGNAAEAASTDPEWSALLDAGGAAYLPRAWWRSARPQTAQSAAWTFFIQNPTGAELLLWLAGKAKDLDAFQTDLPRFASPAVKAAYISGLRKTFGAAFRTPALLETYMRRLHRLATRHQLPGNPVVGDPMSPFIEFATPRRPCFYRRDRDTIYLSIAGRELLFPIDAAQLLQYLLDKAPVTVADFYAQFEGVFDSGELSSFLEALVRDGVIAEVPGRVAR
jgi:hypothetical protein